MEPKRVAAEINLDRYARQLALPEISIGDQERLRNARIVLVGAGGLGAASLPYLASAGIGHITIYDHDDVSVSNLHRQTIYQDAQAGQSKATLAASYAKNLNPDVEITAKAEKLNLDTALNEYDLIIDGSDNFETKILLNEISVKTQTPLLSASVNQWQGQIMLLGGFAKDVPCYHCLFPELPSDARNCNEAGILGTSAGATGVYQAHLALSYLLGLENAKAGTLLTFDFKSLRMQALTIKKDPDCAHCANKIAEWPDYQKEKTMQDMIKYDDLTRENYMIVDVRTDDEIKADPIKDDNLIHMELSTIPEKHGELPGDKLLAFVCAGNVRSFQAADYLKAHGYDNTIVLDKFSIKK